MKTNIEKTIIIPLSKHGKYKGLYRSVIDWEDRDLAELNWNYLPTSRSGYAKRTENRKTVLLHRRVMERKIGRILVTGEIIDHTKKLSKYVMNSCLLMLVISWSRPATSL